jgi:hypothetical protein
MVHIRYLVWLGLVGALSAVASPRETCFQLLGYKGNNHGYTRLCLDDAPGLGFSTFKVDIKIFKGAELAETILGEASKASAGYQVCGGKEKDCYQKPAAVYVHAENSRYNLYLNLQPTFLYLNACVRCGMSVLYLKSEGNYSLSLR